MSVTETESPALVAARAADRLVLQCLTEDQSLLLEAGAGAGKTFSLVEALRYLIASQGQKLRRHNQRIACITYTNAATAIINSRIDNNPLVFTDTIHAFCWSLIKGFQPTLRAGISKMEIWQERLAGVGDIGRRRVEYDLGHRRITDDSVSLHHDDVLALTVTLLPLEKLQTILTARYPFILIDEYQDTDFAVIEAIKCHLLGRKDRPLIALFGDHWQRIYEGTCGRVIHPALKEIGKGANFRSSTSIVKVLNGMRPELLQSVKDEAFVGSATVYHTNRWGGARRTGAGGGHWTGDLPPDVAHQYLESLIARLLAEGWDFAPDKTKVLMLTHNVLASEQGYANLMRLFPYSDQVIKKEDDYIAFFADKLEPACDAFARRRYGEMFEILGDSAPDLGSHAEKIRWSTAMHDLVALRLTGTIGEVVDHITKSKYPVLPDPILRRESEARTSDGDGEVPSESAQRTRQLRQIPYREIIALDQFIDGHTPFATKHSVKGDEFENVLVVVGRGWNRYNFGQYLELAPTPDKISADRRDSFERNRNLFYVACSRPTTRLAILFTQLLSANALQTLRQWFGAEAIHEFVPS